MTEQELIKLNELLHKYEGHIKCSKNTLEDMNIVTDSLLWNVDNVKDCVDREMFKKKFGIYKGL